MTDVVLDPLRWESLEAGALPLASTALAISIAFNRTSGSSPFMAGG